VDMNLQFGNATLFLNLKPQTSIIDVQRHISEIDPEQLRKSLPRHSSGVSLLTGPIRVEEAETFESNKFEAIISLLRASYNYILIDLPKNFDDLTMKTLDGSDVILKVFTTDIPSLFNTFRCFDIFKRLGYGEEKVLPVVNRFDDDGGSALGQLKKPLAYPVFWKIPNQDYKTIISSINLGKPLSSDTPRSQFSQSIAELAEKLIGEDERGSGGEEEKEGLFRKIFRKKET